MRKVLFIVILAILAGCLNAQASSIRTIYVVNHSSVSVSYALRDWNYAPYIHFVQTSTCGLRQYCVDVYNKDLPLPYSGWSSMQVIDGKYYRYRIDVTTHPLTSAQKYNTMCHELGHIVSLTHNGQGCMALPLPTYTIIRPGAYNLARAR